MKQTRLLTADMREAARLAPCALRIEPCASEPGQALMQLPPGEATVHPRDWVELFCGEQSAGIYRVTRVLRDEDGQQVTLRHGLCALEDALITGEGTISGSPGEVLSGILAHQKTALWAVGEVAGGETLRVACDNTNALAALEQALLQMPDLAPTFDQRALPWRLGLKRLAGDDGAEVRQSRNARSVSVLEDARGLCTRVYVDGREGYTDGETIGVYGPIERVLCVPEDASDEQVSAYVRAYLAGHAHPERTVSVDADDISGDTGEALDALALQKHLRVPLPRQGETLAGRITAMSYPDIVQDARHVRVTAGRRSESASDVLRSLMGRGADTSRDVVRNSRLIARNTTRLHDTYTELTKLGDETATRFNEVSIELNAQKAEIDLKASSEVVAEQGRILSEAGIAIKGLEGKVELHGGRLDEIEGWEANADIIIDGANARIDANTERIDKNTGDISAANLAIDGANARIDAEARRIDEANGKITEAGLAIDAVKGEVALKASQSDFDALGNRVTTAESSIKVNADAITSTVRKGEVISSINQTAEEVKITASRIDLSGYVTASQLAAESARINSLYNGDAHISSIAATTIGCTNLSVGGNKYVSRSVEVVTNVTASRETNFWVVTSVNFEGMRSSSQSINFVKNISVETAWLNYLGEPG